jgi:hypothetical protein
MLRSDRVRRLLWISLSLVALWLIGVTIAGALARGAVSREIASRLGESLGAPATIATTDLALIRGRLTLGGVALRRDDLGHLALTIGEVDATLAPLGAALFDRGVRALAVRDVRFELSAAALLHLHNPRRPPLRFGAIVVDDATLVFEASAFLPTLGRIEIHVAHARCGPTTLRTPLSWLLTLEELQASLALPAGISLSLDLRDGRIAVAGSFFGSRPIELPVTLPVVGAEADAREEIRRLIEFGEELATRLVERKASDWLRRKLGGR